jgi:pimeloyl-ACP methyl ester carboxylesterase
MSELREGTVTTPDGRVLAYRDAGAEDAPVVVTHHGTPGTRLPSHPDPRVADGLRTIAYDRPGYGGSDPHSGRRVADAAGDVAALADALGLERFGIFGVSGGGPHALACAAQLRDRVTRTAVHVGVAPLDDPDFDFFAGMAEINVQDYEQVLADPAGHRAHLRPQVAAIKADPLAFLDMLLTQMPDADRRAWETPGARELTVAQWREAMRQDEEGVLEDDLAFVADWGFRLEDIQGPVRLWQGELDTLVPLAHGRHVAARIPGAQLEIVAGKGHILLDETRPALLWAAGLA